MAARADGPFRDLFDFCARVDRRLVNRRTVEALVRAGAFDSLDADRAKLLANTPRAMDAAEAAGAAADQASLFGDASGAGALVTDWLPVAPWSERQRLQEEKIALGFFLTGHPFTAHEHEIRRFVRTRLSDLQPAPQPVWVAGVVAAQRTQMTRRGKMLFVTLDDGTARVDVSVFNELYDANRRIVREDELLVLLGKVSRDDYTGGQRVVAERLLDLSAARREFGKRLRIRLNGNADGAALRNVIAPFAAGEPGGSDAAPALPIVIDYTSTQAQCAIELGAPWRVRPDESLLLAIGERLRPIAVDVEY
jgi:DNA polymerase-3 subunit alpha